MGFAPHNSIGQPPKKFNINPRPPPLSYPTNHHPFLPKMAPPLLLPKLATYWLRRIKRFFVVHRRSPTPLSPVANISLSGREHHTSICDFHHSLLRTPSLFPFFMLVAFEGGSLFRAILLLLSSPLIYAFGENSEFSVRVMTFIAFRGLRIRDIELVARAVLPKVFLEEMHLHAYEAVAATGKRVVVTSLPRVLVEWFLREYLGVSVVVGAELEVSDGGWFSGFLSVSGAEAKKRVLDQLAADVALLGSGNAEDYQFISFSKESYVVSKEDTTAVMPRSKYPKPLIFHDGRLAFLPTPPAFAAFLLWLPLGILFAIIRISGGVFFGYSASIIIAAVTGLRFRVTGQIPISRSGKGVLFVCTHRTLLDPVMLSVALARPVPAVTYSLSRMSEIIAPMRTVRLTRQRERDRETMSRLLLTGDMAVCPEGTTCREPYLLRFSSLFAELTEELVPVALEARSEVLYGTTASGLKWLDPLMFMANPMPLYRVEILEPVPREMTCASGLGPAAVANGIQRLLGEALGYECTGLTRRDKYLMLAGNEGVVNTGKEGN